MATSQEIKGFIAQWLQLGKSIEHVDGVRCFKPSRILGYQGYSQEFEDWWQEFEADTKQWALSGTHHPLSDLYSPLWEISSCARCDMPVPLQASKSNEGFCPCHDLPNWPNTELPQPRVPLDSDLKLRKIFAKLNH
jgi:hypothetical protein